jgi:importin subunit alpha-6/7
VDAVLQAGALPVLVSFLQRGEQAAPELLFEAAWALTNIASTEHTRVLVEAGATPPLARLLLHAAPDVREQAAWCLGNIAGDGPELRDVVLGSGVGGWVSVSID